MCIRDSASTGRCWQDASDHGGRRLDHGAPRHAAPADARGIPGGAGQRRIAGARTSAGRVAGPVSYTHLRAHETVLDLVCRLLLEKKTKQKKTVSRADIIVICRNSEKLTN